MILLIISLELEIFGVAIQKIHQNTKKWCLCEELLIGNDVEAVLVNFCCYDYGANAFEAVQKISTRTLLESCQLIKTANFIATTMKKHLAFHYLLIGDTSQVLFFFLTITNE